jgi:VIT1/CCC1 family predicted Fe2+/Mn2+ transporter
MIFSRLSFAKLYLRNTIFGVADSLVSTVGLLAGIGVSGAARSTVIVTGIVYAFVEAFSMAVGSFLSEESAEEYETRNESSHKKPLLGGVIMFISFVSASFVPIAPYLFSEGRLAIVISIVLSVVALFLVGIASAGASKLKLLRNGAKMAVLGGAAIMIGAAIGYLFRQS